MSTETQFGDMRTEYGKSLVELGEQDIAEELQGFIISAAALNKAVDSLSSTTTADS